MQQMTNMAFMWLLLQLLFAFCMAWLLNAMFCAGGQDFLEQFVVQTEHYPLGDRIFPFLLT